MLLALLVFSFPVMVLAADSLTVPTQSVTTNNFITITCPADVTVVFGDDTSPTATGTATTDDAAVIFFQDVITPTSIIRFWTANDDDGNEAECTQIITVNVPTSVNIDIKPGSDPNSIKCTNDREVITVAILTTADFDATTVNHTSVTFMGARETHINNRSNARSGEPRRHEEDVDGDGETDLVFHFRLGETDLTCDSTEGTLIGETLGGLLILGTDAIRMVNGD